MKKDPPAIPTIRVAIVDDHPIVRAGLAALIRDEHDLSVCGEAASRDEALALVADAQPDVMLVDLSLGDASGLDVVRELAATLRIVVVTVHRDPIRAERALAAGALGYVHKSDAANDVVRAIRRAHAGRSWVSRSLLRPVENEPTGSANASPSRMDSLSARELEVFERIGQGMSTQQIGAALGLSAKTVQTYRDRLKVKLGCKTGPELAVRAARWDDASA
jgi:DNA-binding NarL/FixJ family response regulator